MGRDPDAALAEVARVLLPGGVPGAVAVARIRDAEGGLDVRKPTCYLFEFDPNRALDLLSEYGIRLAARERRDTPSRRSAS